MSKTITITEIKVLGGQGKVAEVTYVCEGRNGKAKAWTAEVEQGKEYAVEFEKKSREYQGQTTEETWIKVPKAGGRGGGFGGGKPDPARAENDRLRLELERQKHQDFLEKWDHDRVVEADRQASIQAQVVVKAAVDLCIARGDYSQTAVEVAANHIAATLLKVQKQVGGGQG